MSTIYIKQILFHQSKLRPDVQLQKRHIVHSKVPLYMIEVSTLSAQLSLGTELFDWYQDATSVSYGNLLTDLLPRTGDRPSSCTNTGFIRSKFYVPDRLKQLNSSDDELEKSLHSPRVRVIFPQVQKSIPPVLSKKLIRYFCECIINLLIGNLKSSVVR